MKRIKTPLGGVVDSFSSRSNKTKKTRDLESANGLDPRNAEILLIALQIPIIFSKLLQFLRSSSVIGSHLGRADELPTARVTSSISRATRASLS